MPDQKRHICTRGFDQAMVAINALDEEEAELGEIVKCRLYTDNYQYDQALSIITELEKKTQRPEIINFGLVMVKINLAWRQGSHDSIPGLIIEGDKYSGTFISSSNVSNCFLGHYYNTIGNYYWDKGELSKALAYYTKCLEIWENLGYNIEIAKTLNNLGIIHYAKGEYGLALRKYQENLDIKLKTSPNVDLSAALSNIGEVYLDIGELNRAIRYFLESVTAVLRINPDDKSSLAFRYVNLGLAYTFKGDLVQALDYCQKAKSIYEDLGIEYMKARALSNLGNVWYYKNQFARAEECFQQSLQLLKHQENDFEISLVLYRMILIKITLNDYSETKKHLDHLQNIALTSENPVVELRYRLANALLNKSIPGSRSKTIAISLFNDILDSRLLTIRLKFVARMGMCELLLLDYEDTGNDDHYKKIEELIEDIYEYGRGEKAYPFIVRSLEYKGRLNYLTGFRDKVLVFFDIALFYAEMENLELESSRLRQLRQDVSADIDHMYTPLTARDFTQQGDDRIVEDYLTYIKDRKKA